jgi:hypothetical protein
LRIENSGYKLIKINFFAVNKPKNFINFPENSEICSVCSANEQEEIKKIYDADYFIFVSTPYPWYEYL